MQFSTISPFLNLSRLLETYITFAPRGFESFQKAIPLWVKEKLFKKNLLQKDLKKLKCPDVEWEGKIFFL